jgi:hypothetical protein
MASAPHSAPAPAQGIVFAAGADGARSTSAAGTRIVAAALQVLDPAAAGQARAETRWRSRYPVHLRRLVQCGVDRPEQVVASAQAALDAAWTTLQWQDPVGTQTLRDALDSRAGPALDTRTVRGEGNTSPAPWTVPLHGKSLQGEALLAQVRDWQQRGIIEPGAAEALARCVAHPEWFDLSDRTLVLLGAASEAGPLRWLMRWRATVVAVDIARADTWQRLEAEAREGNGVLVAPVHRTAEDISAATAAPIPGVDLLRDSPALAAWLQTLPGPLDIAALAYLDGERHVRVVLAMDMVMQALCAADARTGLAFLATPTDVFAVPRAVEDAALAAFARRPLASRALQGLLALATGTRFFQPNTASAATSQGALGVTDSLVLQQGPNYALAKRVQQWRALVARAAGHRVSLNVAPSTTTSSVVKNPALAAGFAGADSFGIEVFEPATTNALMAALWVHDLRHPGAAAHPATPLPHPLELFTRQACHGGLWRCPYLPRSALPFAAALGWVRQRLRIRR